MSTYLICLVSAYMEIAHVGDRWDSPCFCRRTVSLNSVVWC